MTQVVLVSTLYGAATVAAAIDSGALPRADRRILVVANTTATPEVATLVDEFAAFAAVSDHFDAIHHYNDAIAPMHPAAWTPRTDDVPMWERALRSIWDLGRGPVDLVVESIQVPPARALAAVFASSQVVVYADGLMTYGPTRDDIGPGIGDRVRQIVHPDLVPGLRPALLREFGTAAIPFDVGALRKVLDGMHEQVAAELPGTYDSEAPPALVVGQFLSALGVISVGAEQLLHQRMICAATAAGVSTVWFKAHPSAPLFHTEQLRDWARNEGHDLVVVSPTTPAETVFTAMPPRFVVGCFSTALLTAPRLYGIPAATVGTDDLLEALRPYENSNRIPVTIAAELLPDLEVTRQPPALPLLGCEVTAVRVQPLVDTVSYCMQPRRLAALRDDSERWLADHVDGPSRRYFKGRRLTSLGLPGGSPIPLVRQVAGPAKRWARRRGDRGRRYLLRAQRIVLGADRS